MSLDVNPAKWFSLSNTLAGYGRHHEPIFRAAGKFLGNWTPHASFQIRLQTLSRENRPAQIPGLDTRAATTPASMMNLHRCSTPIVSRQAKPHTCPHAIVARRTLPPRLRASPLHRLSRFQPLHHHQAIMRHAAQFQMSAHKPFNRCIRRPPAPNMTLLRQRQIDDRRLDVKTKTVGNVLEFARRHMRTYAVRGPMLASVCFAPGQ